MTTSAATRLTTLAGQVARLSAGDAAIPDAVELAERAGFDLDGWQRDVLVSTAPRLLLNCSRQSGKSTVTALLATHTALTRPGALVLLLSPSQRQSAELFRKVMDSYRAAGQTVQPEAETLLRLELANGARILSLPGTERTVRGFSGVDLIVIDEAARVPNDLYAAVRPMLAVSGGRLIALSTPWTKRGFFYEAWTSAEPWERFEVPATACARIPAAFLAEEQRSMGELWFRSEYMCEFLDAESQAFRREDIDSAFSMGVEAWPL
jgi:hypothetical protein